MKILVRRTGAFGDVLDTTPVIRRLRQENPEAEIDVDTQYFGVFLDSPRGIGRKRSDVEYNIFIDLDGAFEQKLRRVGVVESYMEVAFGDRGGSTQLELTYDPRPPFKMDWSTTITMHAARSWPQRTLPHGFWTDLANELVKRGWNICCIGTNQDWSMRGIHKGIVDTSRLQTRDASGQLQDTSYTLTPHAQAAIIGASRAFVCSGSGPMMLAQCTDVPIVAMETMSLPWIFERERHGSKGWRMTSVMPMRNGKQLWCAGCSHSLLKPVTYFECPNSGDEHNVCVTLFDPIDIANKVEEAARDTMAS